MKHLSFLITGIVVTVVFFILSCSDGFNIWEQLFFNQGYNDKMYNLDMYPVIAAITILVAWGGAAIYYYAINSVKFDRWYHWLAVLGVVAVLAPVVCYIYNDTKGPFTPCCLPHCSTLSLLTRCAGGAVTAVTHQSPNNHINN